MCKCRNPDFLGFSKQDMVFERFIGVDFVSFVVLLNERFWVCLRSHATIPSLRGGLHVRRRGSFVRNS